MPVAPKPIPRDCLKDRNDIAIGRLCRDTLARGKEVDDKKSKHLKV